MKRKRDSIFYMHAHIGAEVGWKKLNWMGKARTLRLVTSLNLLSDWTVDDQANDKGGVTCELSLKQIAKMDEA